VEILEILAIISQILLKKYRITSNISIYWLVLIRTARLHVSTGYLVIARPVRYKKKIEIKIKIKI
jgi:hypothetical protein